MLDKDLLKAVEDYDYEKVDAIFKKYEEFEGWRDRVNVSNKHYVVVDTRLTMDHGWETMVFASTSRGEILNYTALNEKRYASKEEAKKGHYEMIEKFEENEY